MKFYNRTSEIAELQRIKEMAYNDHSKLTVITGRRRIGKTSLILNALKDDVIVYLFVSRKEVRLICAVDFCIEIERQLSVLSQRWTLLQRSFAFCWNKVRIKNSLW